MKDRTNLTVLLIILIVVLLVNSCSDGTTGPAGFTGWQGNGTESDPYRISRPEHLKALANSVNSGNNYEGKHFRMTSNLGLSRYQSGEGWMPIGHIIIHRSGLNLPGSYGSMTAEEFFSSFDDPGRDQYWEEYPFKGIFDGNGNIITGLKINRPDSTFVGLFGFVNHGTIKNLGLEGVDVTAYAAVGGLVGLSRESTVNNCYVKGSITGDYTVGGLVGDNFRHSSVSNSFTEGTVSGSVQATGGLIGRSTSHSTVTNSHSKAAVNGVVRVGGLIALNVHNSSVINSFTTGEVSGSSNVGGLAGYNYSQAEIVGCYSSASVEGDEQVGGLVGLNSSALISNSYSTGSVTGTMAVGGLIGQNSSFTNVSACYSTGPVSGSSYVGGLIGSTEWIQAILSNCYWDILSTGQQTSAGGEGRMTDQMTYPYDDNSYVDWEFDTIWLPDQDYSINNGYPYLIWQ